MVDITVKDLAAEVEKLGIKATTRIGGIDKDEYLATQGVVAKRAGLDVTTAMRQPGNMNRLVGAIALMATAPIDKPKVAKKPKAKTAVIA